MDKFGNKFGTSFQIKIISSLLADRIFLQQVYDIIKPEMFDSEAHEWIVTKTLSHFDNFQQLPTLDVFKNEVDRVQQVIDSHSVRGPKGVSDKSIKEWSDEMHKSRNVARKADPNLVALELE